MIWWLESDLVQKNIATSPSTWGDWLRNLLTAFLGSLSFLLPVKDGMNYVIGVVGRRWEIEKPWNCLLGLCESHFQFSSSTMTQLVKRHSKAGSDSLATMIAIYRTDNWPHVCKHFSFWIALLTKEAEDLCAGIGKFLAVWLFNPEETMGCKHFG